MTACKSYIDRQTNRIDPKLGNDTAVQQPALQEPSRSIGWKVSRRPALLQGRQPHGGSPVTHHRGIEATHGGEVSSLAARLAVLHQELRAGGPLDVSQAFAPRRGGHQPQEGKESRHPQVLAGRGTHRAQSRATITHVSSPMIMLMVGTMMTHGKWKIKKRPE